MRRKLATALLTGAIILSGMCLQMSVEASESENNLSETEEKTEDTAGEREFSYTVLEDGTAEITGYVGENRENLIIPDTIEGYTVTSIGREAFSNNGFTGTLTLAESIRNIGENAFRFCEFTGELTLPKSLVSIGDSAFYSNNFSGNLEIPDSVTSVGARAFYRNEFTGTLILSKNLTSIGESAFYSLYSNSGFTGILTLPPNLISVGKSAFAGNHFTGDLKIPDSVTSIGASAFYSNDFTGDIILPSTIQEIGDSAFETAHVLDIYGDFLIPALSENIGDKILGNSSPQLRVGTEMGIHQTRKAQVILYGMRLSSPIITNWSSSDEAIAKIDENGVITAVAVGEVTLRAELYNGESCEAVLKIGTKDVRNDIILKTEPAQEKFDDLWVGDTLFFYVSGESGSNSSLSSIEVASGEECVTIEKTSKYTVKCNQKGFVKLLIHYKNIDNPIEITINIKEKKTANFNVVKSLKLGTDTIWRTNFVSYENFLYGAETPVVCINNKDKENFAVSAGWGMEWEKILEREGNCYGLFYMDSKNGVNHVNFTEFPTYPGTIEIMLYMQVADVYVGKTPVEKYTVEIVKPIINDNIKKSYVVGEEENLEAYLENTDLKNMEIDKIKTSNDKSLKLLYYIPKLTIVSGEECLALKGEQKLTSLTLKQGLQFKKAGTVTLKISYEPFGNKALWDRAYQPEKTITIQVKEKSQSNTQSNKKTQKVSKITLSGISNKIAAGKKIKLTAKVSPSNAANKKVKWKSSNTKVATVSSSGVVTLKKKSAGKTVKITATATDGSGVKAQYKITSMKGAVKKIMISGGKSVKAGKTLKLKGKVAATHKKANTKLKWTSSNKKYATVNNSGKIKTYKAGKGKKVRITAEATDGSGKKKTVIIKIK